MFTIDKNIRIIFLDFALSSTGVNAETEGEIVTLPDITVEAPAPDTGLTNTAVEELRSILGRASVIEAEDDCLGGAVLGGQDALRSAPGVYAHSRDGYEDIRFSIRGSGISLPFGNRGARQFVTSMNFLTQR